ncbi:tRNA-dihydrouridine(20a/20b) synthase [NAD(P)+]-like [Amyelois transitella]|uniref:tRNA-dihydrouridine(20a/20b) synthase [NAD(P)+]-like n=1 Tax=Amyelois transitella TaxID=680683 RepID=UPI00298FF15B|nr:tRNA-dihydrouridine(20a/20b) synthase [NAD(P)+]-like [Amyelois transitella]
MKDKSNISELFHNTKVKKSYLKVCAPMVRYSKVQFRTLVKNFGVDLTFTPMILADSFCQNMKARASEFSTTSSDTPLIAQFAANNADDFIDASRLIYPYTDGVDLNCGCPQKWAINDGYGCSMLSKPEVIHDIVRGVRSNLPNNFSVSVKIRVLKELKKTINLCQQLEKCGVTFLTVHGRTPEQKSGDCINTNALKEVCQSVQVPIVANGGVKSLADADELHNTVCCDGVMAASGLLTNPALFSGANTTPLNCVKQWIDLKNQMKDRITFQCYHHHLVFMLEKVLSKQQKRIFNHLGSFETVDDYLDRNILGSINCTNECSNCSLDEFVTCDFPEEITLKHAKKCRCCARSVTYCVCKKYDYDASDGSFFLTYVDTNDENVGLNIFDES